MTPREAKTFAASCSCKACKAITENDYYINYPAKPGDGVAKWIQLRYGPKPCRAGEACKRQRHGQVEQGEWCWWIGETGVWHKECK